MSHERSMKNLGVGPKFPGKGSTASGKDNDEQKREDFGCCSLSPVEQRKLA